MKKPRILVCGALDQEGLEELCQNFQVDNPNPKLDREEILEILPQYDACLTIGIKIDKEFLDRGENLQIISSFGVGFDHIDLAYAKKKRIVVSNTPKAVRIPTAESAVAMILASVKRFPFYDSHYKKGEWVDSSLKDNRNYPLEKSRIGLVGFGRIGRTVAKMLEAFDVQIQYFQRHPYQGGDLSAKYVDFDTLLKTSDIISLHLPLSEETKGMFGKEEFSKMEQNPFFINTARGKIVKEDDLIWALEEGKIRGAALDVFEKEGKVNEKLTSFDQVLLTPHVAATSKKARIDIIKEAAANLLAYFKTGKANTPIA